ncbi:MAG: flagellar hook-associated protein FlgL [Rhodocyclaceae bacterium]|nr:flagellar hook-associated protein FlgL [Rhodocyclaceae bacterium]
MVMRISTSMIFDAGVSAINAQTAAMLHTQQQLSTGRRILKPSDDPVDASRALVISQSRDVAQQQSDNQKTTESMLKLEENYLANADELLVRVRELAVQAGNTTWSASDRRTIAAEVRGRYDQLLGIANAQDGNEYIFSGYKGDTEPFSGALGSVGAQTFLGVGAEAVTYSGDDGQRKLQVAPGRQLAVNDAGSEVFYTSGGSSVFKVLANFVSVLEGSGSGNGYSTDIADIITGLDSSQESVVNARSTVGTRMSELTSLSAIVEELILGYSKAISTIQDVDYAQAISSLERQQTGLEAAQKSFLRISQLSMFNYI